jgi:hypothetical protein
MSSMHAYCIHIRGAYINMKAAYRIINLAKKKQRLKKIECVCGNKHSIFFAFKNNGIGQYSTNLKIYYIFNLYILSKL